MQTREFNHHWEFAGCPPVLKEGFIMANAADLTREVINELAFTPEELKELERARTMPITFDEDCPETTPERAMKFRRVNPVRRVAN